MAMSSRRDFMDEAEVPVVKADLGEHQAPPVHISFAPAYQDDDTNNPPERFLMDQMRMRPRAMSHHLQSTEIPSRRSLIWKARGWRAGMSLGMIFHGWHKIKAPKVSFKRKISTDTIPIELCFYLPHDYEETLKYRPEHRWPIVVNFHGGGFVLGSATDDRYWARIILEKTPAMFMSVGYRRAPEHPFPQPVDDCVEALLYLQTHAEELHIDPSQVVLSGFSAGANLAFTVPFRLTYQYEQPDSDAEDEVIPQKKNDSNFVPEPDQVPKPGSVANKGDESTPATSNSAIPIHVKGVTPSPSLGSLRRTGTNMDSANGSTTNLLNIPGPRSKLLRHITQESNLTTMKNLAAKNRSTNSLPLPTPLSRTTSSSTASSDEPYMLRIVSIISWYPLLDWTSSRAEKIRHSRNPKKTLPRVFTDLFDFSYLPAPDREGHHCSPYASPSLAPDHMIRDGLPTRIQMWLCEWDMLLAEGEQFTSKLKGLGKDVQAELVPGVPHAFDKSPSPWRNQEGIDVLYRQSAEKLNEVFRMAQRRDTVGEGIGLGGLR